MSCWDFGNMEVSDEDLRVVDVIKSASPDIQPLEDLAAKSEILKISPSIVGLESFIGEQGLCVSSGIIINCEEIMAQESTGASSFIITILTGASLLVCATDDSSLAHGLKVKVHLYDRRTSWGEVGPVDLHYNLAMIKMRSDAPAQPATFKCISDDLPIVPAPFLRPHPSEGYKVLIPGSKVIALARYCRQSVLMHQCGAFSIQHCGLDCRELLMTTCEASPKQWKRTSHLWSTSPTDRCGLAAGKHYNGGPLITWDGDVIGVNFSHEGYCSFLPSNIVSKCLENMTYGSDVRRPWHGMTLASLYAADIAFLEKITRKFPSVSKGALVKKVERESPAEVAGFLPDDVIIRCDGKAVTCSLKFFEEILDTNGGSVDVEVVRPTGEHLKLSVLVEQTIVQRYNRWPVHNWRLPDRIAMAAMQRIHSHVGYLTSRNLKRRSSLLY